MKFLLEMKKTTAQLVRLIATVKVILETKERHLAYFINHEITLKM